MSAILVDLEYLRLLEHLHEELHQARVVESTVRAERHLVAALAVAEEVSEMVMLELTGRNPWRSG